MGSFSVWHWLIVLLIVVLVFVRLLRRNLPGGDLAEDAVRVGVDGGHGVGSQVGIGRRALRFSQPRMMR